MKKKDSNRVIIFDTTLRDGEQSPGASMNLEEKLQVARALRNLGVDIIEGGFPIASPGDFEAVRAIAREVEGSTIAGLARCNKKDIDRAWEALRDAPRARIHVFLATSAIHREFKLQMAKEEIVRRAVESVQRAREYCEDVEFSPEDAGAYRTGFLVGGRREGYRSWGGYGQHPGHGGVCDARAVRQSHSAPQTECTQHRRRHHHASIVTTIWASPLPTASRRWARARAKSNAPSME